MLLLSFKSINKKLEENVIKLQRLIISPLRCLPWSERLCSSIVYLRTPDTGKNPSRAIKYEAFVNIQENTYKIPIQ